MKRKEEKPQLAKHEKLVICPNCKNTTLLISDIFEYVTCINLNCGYWKKKENYQDALGYSWEKIKEASELSEDFSKEINKLVKNAPEKPFHVTKRYDAILINPKNKDDWESGHKNLEIFGVIKSENGLFVEKIKVSDVLNINSFFKKLKGFELSIDIPYPGDIICIYCHNYLIQVNSHEFIFVKKRK